MSKETKSTAHGNNHLFQFDEMVPKQSRRVINSEQEPDPEVSFHQLRPPQPVPSIFRSYIEGPKMDWTVNNVLLHRFF